MKMKLGELLHELECARDRGVYDVRGGFGMPHSYRGYYEEVSFSPVDYCDIHDAIFFVNGAIGYTFTGYKGGEFKMTGDTPVNIAHSGMCSLDDSDELTLERLKVMLGEEEL